MRRDLNILTVLALILVLSCCTHPSANISFYYWRTNGKISEPEKKCQNDLGVKQLYLRLFDVDRAEGDAEPQPKGIITQPDTAAVHQIIPVVFITNRSFLHLDLAGSHLLARRVKDLCSGILPRYTELQIDCDWSDATSENYFFFLRCLDTLLTPGGCQLSCTLRLHQVKYASRTGIPPVKRATLMFYNMGNISDPGEGNSIFNPEAASRYIAFLKSYNLPLDIALPLYSQQVHFRHGQIVELRSKNNALDTKGSLYKTAGKGIFMVREDSLVDGIFLRKGDLLRNESLTPQELRDAADMLSSRLADTPERRIVFFDLDEYNLKRYDEKLLKEVAASFY